MKSGFQMPTLECNRREPLFEAKPYRGLTISSQSAEVCNVNVDFLELHGLGFEFTLQGKMPFYFLTWSFKAFHTQSIIFLHTLCPNLHHVLLTSPFNLSCFVQLGRKRKKQRMQKSWLNRRRTIDQLQNLSTGPQKAEQTSSMFFFFMRRLRIGSTWNFESGGPS